MLTVIVTISGRSIGSVNSYCDNHGRAISSPNSYCENNGEIYVKITGRSM